MRALIVEDDLTSQKVLENFLFCCGECDIAVNGEEAVRAFEQALEKNEPYDLICMDIMMPVQNGQETLKKIREIENMRGIETHDEVKVIMTTALEDPKNVLDAYNDGGASSYLVKPIHKEKLLDEVRKLGLMCEPST